MTDQAKPIVPIQPDIASLRAHRQRLVTWNPYAQKNQALCYQFETGDDPCEVKVLPDACVNFLVKCDPAAPSLLINGMQTSPSSLELERNTVYFGFKPYSVNGMKASDFAWKELTDRSLSADGFDVGGLNEQIIFELASTGDFDVRTEAMRAYAASRLTDSSYVPSLAEFEELEVCRAKGNLKMDELSDTTGYTDRWCRKKFKESVGVSIKCYSSIIRFQNAVRMLLNGDSPSVADVVYRNGYFDQSHLTREFRRFAGETPARFCKCRPNVLL